MLFTVNKSPFITGNLKSCLRYVAKCCPILLYEDGVYGAVAGSTVEPMVKEAMKNVTIYALKEDVNARGLNNLIEGIKLVDYDGFVDLVAEHNVCPWI
ncbi:MAG: sulfurtransferase complex subunit TusB [Nitrospinae bacterium]|nr:sulfurtransferase complex subunit TusB [Nitrospinota bacterium]